MGDTFHAIPSLEKARRTLHEKLEVISLLLCNSKKKILTFFIKIENENKRTLKIVFIDHSVAIFTLFAFSSLRMKLDLFWQHYSDV